MVNYKQSLIFFICMISLRSMSAMETKMYDKETRTAITARLNELLNFKTDSLLITLGKDILTNEIYNHNPKLLAAFGYLLAHLYIYTSGENKYYDAFMEGHNGIGLIQIHNKLDDLWRKEKMKTLNVQNLKEARNFFADFEPSVTTNSEEYKQGCAVYKKWMHDQDFESTKFLIETACELMKKNDIIEQETNIVLGLLKLYDDK